MNIRTIESRDWPALMAVQAACYTELEPESEAALKSKWQLAPATCLALADAQDRLVGYCLAHPWNGEALPKLGVKTAPADGERLYLHDLAIAPSARGKGRAKSLVAAVLMRAKRQGFKKVTLVSVQGSQRFWQGCGFAPITRQAPPDYGDEAQVMAQHL